MTRARKKPTAPTLNAAVAQRAIGFVDFCTHVLGVRLTPGQKVLAGVAYDGLEPSDFTGEERELARQLFGDVDIIPPKARAVVVIVAGARAGKSYVLGGLRLLHLALTVPLTTLAPGEVAVAVMVAPTLKLAQQTLSYIKGAAKECTAIAQLIESETSEALTIRRPDGPIVSLECLPASAKGAALRGRSLVAAVLDEAAMFRDADTGVVNDAEVYKAVAPRVVQGGQVIIESTPWAEVGLLFELFKANHGSPTTAIAAHAPTLLLRNDEHTRAYVAREEQRDPANAAREFGAVFMSNETGAFFDASAIAAAVNDNAVTQPVPEWAFVGVGADFGFRSDSSALVTASNDGETINVLDVLEIQPKPNAPLQPSSVVRSFAEAVRKRKARSVVSDGHYREAIREHLREHSLSFVGAPEGAIGKFEVYTKVRVLLHEGAIRIPNNERLIRQLKEVVSRPTAGGLLSITSPRWKSGGHGDLVSAFVLAVYTAAQRSVSPPHEGPKPGTPEYLEAEQERAKQATIRRVEREMRKRGRAEWKALERRRRNAA